jgi:photosystem II stability/assembly factor-like uncharacterized protein
MEQEWITDRLPTATDADEDGDVLAPLSQIGGETHVLWNRVREGEPWKHSPFLQPPVVRKPVQIAVSDDTVYALCDDGTVFRYTGGFTGWTQLPLVPQP